MAPATIARLWQCTPDQIAVRPRHRRRKSRFLDEHSVFARKPHRRWRDRGGHETWNTYASTKGDRVDCWPPAPRPPRSANLLMEIDRALVRETMEALSQEELLRNCSQRGLNVEGLNRLDMLEYLGAWTRISGQLDAGSASLLLHLPVLLGYNHRTRHCDSSSV